MKALYIAANSLRRFYRDRTALFFTVALPVTIILLIGTATSQFAENAFPLGIVEESSGPLSSDLRREFGEAPTVALESFGDAESLAKAVRRGSVAAGLVIPSGYDESLRSGESVTLELLVDQARTGSAAIRAAISSVVSSQGAGIQAAAFASTHGGRTFDENLTAARLVSDELSSSAVAVETEIVRRRGASEPTLDPGIGYQTPSMLILFVFITSLAGAALLVQSRQLRVTERMFGTPTSATTILAGEGLSRFAIAGTQALIIFLVGLVLFGVEWGAPAGALVLIVLFVLVGSSFGMLAGTVFRTPEQAGALGAPLGIAMGMLGGTMWPLEIVPDSMRVLGHAFPHAWAMDAWIELIGRGGGIGDVLLELGVLAGFVAVVLPLAIWRLRRAIVS